MDKSHHGPAAADATPAEGPTLADLVARLRAVLNVSSPTTDDLQERVTLWEAVAANLAGHDRDSVVSALVALHAGWLDPFDEEDLHELQLALLTALINDGLHATTPEAAAAVYERLVAAMPANFDAVLRLSPGTQLEFNLVAAFAGRRNRADYLGYDSPGPAAMHHLHELARRAAASGVAMDLGVLGYLLADLQSLRSDPVRNLLYLYPLSHDRLLEAAFENAQARWMHEGHEPAHDHDRRCT